jgi:hypothetical protein
MVGNSFFSTVQGLSSTGTPLTVPAQNAAKFASVYVDKWGPFNTIGYYVTTADTSTTNLYDIGGYGPGCLAGAANVPLAFHTGALAGNTLAPTTGFHSHALSATNVVLTPGWYCVGYTGNASTNVMVIGGNTGSTFFTQFATNVAVASASTTGAFNSTITAPATAQALQQQVGIWLF